MPLCRSLCGHEKAAIHNDESIAVVADVPRDDGKAAPSTSPAPSAGAAFIHTGPAVTLPQERIIPSDAHLFAPGPRDELQISVQYRVAWNADPPFLAYVGGPPDSARDIDRAVSALPAKTVTDNDFPGYSAECSFQLAALANGTYASQLALRNMVHELEGTSNPQAAEAPQGNKAAKSGFWGSWRGGRDGTKDPAAESAADLARSQALGASTTALPAGDLAATVAAPTSTLDLARHGETIGRRLGLVVDVLQCATDLAAGNAASTPTDPNAPSAPADSASAIASHTSTSAAMTLPGAASRRAMQWTRRHLEAAHVVVAGFYASVLTLNKQPDAYDRILPIVGYVDRSDLSARGKKSGKKSAVSSPAMGPADAPCDGDICVHALRIATLASAGAKTVPRSNLGVSREEVLNNDARVSTADLIEYGFPKDHCVCAAFAGIPDVRRESLRVSLQVSTIHEPDSRAMANAGPNIPRPAVTISATVFGVRPGSRYALLRYNGGARVPSSDFLHSMWDQRINFVAPRDLAPRQPVVLPNVDQVPAAGVAVYRCVEVRDAAASTASAASGPAAPRIPGAKS